MPAILPNSENVFKSPNAQTGTIKASTADNIHAPLKSRESDITRHFPNNLTTKAAIFIDQSIGTANNGICTAPSSSINVIATVISGASKMEVSAPLNDTLLNNATLIGEVQITAHTEHANAVTIGDNTFFALSGINSHSFSDTAGPTTPTPNTPKTDIAKPASTIVNGENMGITVIAMHSELSGCAFL